MEQIKLNTIPSGVPSVCHISQFDNTSRVIRCYLFNGADPLTLTGSETIRLFMRKSDNSRAEFEIESASGSFIDLVITSEMSDIAGDSECKFQITDSEKTVGTLNFKMIVEPDAYGDSLKTRSISGPIATFETDLAEDLIKLDVDLEPVQDLHGYDYPWPAGGGVNKITVNRTKGNAGAYGPNVTRDWDYTKYYVGFSYNNYYTEDNIVSYNVGNDVVSVTQTRNTYGIAFPIEVKPNHQYYVGCTFGGTVKLAASYFDSTGSIIRYDSNMGTSRIITTPGNCSTLVLVVYDGVASGVSVSASNIFINDPATVTEYTPYANICPISGHDSAQLFRTGKNLLKDIKTQNGPNQVWLGQGLTPLFGTFLKSGTYTIKYKTAGSINSIYYQEINASSNVPLGTNLEKTFTIDKSSYYRFWLYKSSGVNAEDISDVQLELGSTATDYEPYSSEPTPITVNFGQTVYKGMLYSELRKILVTKVQKTFDGSTDEPWRFNNTGSDKNRAYVKIEDAKAASDIQSNYLKNYSAHTAYPSIYSGWINSSSQLLVGVPTSITSLTDWTAFLALNPLDVLYEIAEPFFIDLTQIQTASIDSTPIASFETTLAMPLNTSEHSFSCSQAEGTPTPDSPIPITGVSEIKVFRIGKNLLDKESYEWIGNSNIIFGGTNTTISDSLILGPGTYTLYCSHIVAGFYIDNNSGAIKRAYNTNSTTFSISSRQAVRINFYIAAVTKSDLLSFDYQLELGSTATPYEPYSGESITVSLGGTYYGGKLVQSEDGSRKIVLDKAFTKINALTWTYVPSFTYFNAYPTNLKQNSDAGKKLDGLASDIYTNRTASQAGSGDIDLSIAGYQTAICIKHKAYTDVNSFIAAVGDHDIVYPLETPIEIDLPDGDPLTTLVGENNVFCNTGDTALTYYYNMVADPIRIPALVGTNNVYSDAGDVDVEYYTTLEGGND